MQRETFVSILSALLAEANEELMVEARNLLFWRGRTLREERVRAFAPGDEVEYLLRDGKTHRVARVSHLNKLSLSLWAGEGRTTAVPIERIVGKVETPLEEAWRKWEDVLREEGNSRVE